MVTQSIQVAENVAEYMRATGELEEGKQMDVDVDEALEQRREKRKDNAKEKAGGAKKPRTKK